MDYLTLATSLIEEFKPSAIAIAEDIRDEGWEMEWIWSELTNRRADERIISHVESHDQAMVGGKSLLLALAVKAIYHSMNAGSRDLRAERAASTVRCWR